MIRRLLYILCLLALVSCMPIRVPERPALETGWTIQEQWACGNSDLRPWVSEWHTEAARRYDEFFLLVVHGQTSDNEWYAFPDDGGPVSVVSLIARFRERGVDERIVLVVCNPGGHELRAPGVSYAGGNVWARPDRQVPNVFIAIFRDVPEDGIGSINEFIHNP